MQYEDSYGSQIPSTIGSITKRPISDPESDISWPEQRQDPSLELALTDTHSLYDAEDFVIPAAVEYATSLDSPSRRPSQAGVVPAEEYLQEMDGLRHILATEVVAGTVLHDWPHKTKES